MRTCYRHFTFGHVNGSLVSLQEWLQKHCTWAVILEYESTNLFGAFESKLPKSKSNVQQAMVFKSADIQVIKKNVDQWKTNYETNHSLKWSLNRSDIGQTTQLQTYMDCFVHMPHTQYSGETMINLSYFFRSICKDFIFHYRSTEHLDLGCIVAHFVLLAPKTCSVIQTNLQQLFGLQAKVQPGSDIGKQALRTWILSPHLNLHGPWASNPRVFTMDHITKFRHQMAREPWQHWMIELQELYPNPTEITIFNLYNLDNDEYQAQKDEQILYLRDLYGPDAYLDQQNQPRVKLGPTDEDDWIDLTMTWSQRGHHWFKQCSFLQYMCLFYNSPLAYAFSCPEIINHARAFPYRKCYHFHLVDEYFGVAHAYELHNQITNIASGIIYGDPFKNHILPKVEPLPNTPDFDTYYRNYFSGYTNFKHRSLDPNSRLTIMANPFVFVFSDRPVYDSAGRFMNVNINDPPKDSDSIFLQRLRQIFDESSRLKQVAASPNAKVTLDASTHSATATVEVSGTVTLSVAPDLVTATATVPPVANQGKTTVTNSDANQVKTKATDKMTSNKRRRVE